MQDQIMLQYRIRSHLEDCFAWRQAAHRFAVSWGPRTVLQLIPVNIGGLLTVCFKKVPERLSSLHYS
jgi:hypothetical protein